MDAQVDHAQRRTQLIRDQRVGRVRDEDLAAVTGCTDPCGAMDVQAHVLLGHAPRLPRVNAHPIADGDPVGPPMTGYRKLPVDGRLDRGARRRKDEVESVARRTALKGAVARERLSEEAMVIGQHLRIAVAQRLEQARRALDVGEDERDGPRQPAGPGVSVDANRDSCFDPWASSLRAEPHDGNGR